MSTTISVPTTSDTTAATTKTTMPNMATTTTNSQDDGLQQQTQQRILSQAAQDLLVVCIVGGQQQQQQQQLEQREQQEKQPEQDKNEEQFYSATAAVGGNGGADSGRASVNEFDSSLDETLTTTTTTIASEIVGIIGGGDGNESIEQLSKKQCTEANNGNNKNEFYASSGSQTKWYLKPSEMTINTVAVDGEQLILLPDKNVCAKVKGEGNLVGETAVGKTTTLCANNAYKVTTSLIINGGDGGSGEVIYEDNCQALSKSSIFPRSTTATTTTTNDGVSIIGIRNGYHPMNLSQQMRAVSSPSLTEIMPQQHQQCKPKEASEANDTTTMTSPAKTTANAIINNGSNNSNISNGSNNSNNSNRSQTVGVLQKFKRTLTNFNKNPNHQLQISQQQQQQQTLTATATAGANERQASTTAAAAATTTTMPTVTVITTSTTTAVASNEINANNEDANASGGGSGDSNSGIYRFGPLIWRSSKERRKTKFNRRDKCNSGDSGIQIELENDEQFARVLTTGTGASAAVGGGSGEGTMNATAAATNATAIRRTNSAKASSITEQSAGNVMSSCSGTALNAKAKVLRKMELHERQAPESLPTRSLSQPNGLETYGIVGYGAGSNGRGDLEDSDSDSVASHDEASTSAYYPIYAEVLYNFTAGGPQELGLERGTLIEILRKEVGPWWFGRIKKEDASLVEEILDPELGWFPKEFVRVIQCPEADAFFLAQMPQRKCISTTQQQDPAANSDAAEVPVPVVDFGNAGNASDETETTMIIDQSNITTIVIESPSSLAQTATTTSLPTPPLSARSVNVMLDNADVLHRSAIRELLETEVNYVKLLAAICEGYLPAMSKRIDIFSPNSIRLIFSNIAAIYKFQKKFLDALRRGIEQNQIAKVFLKMHKGFLCYSTYCNAYPRALIELESYDRIKDARTILENCRESENLAELPLSAHLLAPVQRICRYPLHLAEIIKTAKQHNKCSDNDMTTSTNTNDTDADIDVVDSCDVNDDQHISTKPNETTDYEQLDVSQLDVPDTHERVTHALNAMKSITEAVNEGKRHSETIARHQASFQAFKGPPLHLHSTRFFLQIDATRQKQNLWNSSYTLFLFDNQLVYCKRDIIKRNHFVYKGRIFLDRCRVVNVRDGKMFGHTIKNSLRIFCEARDKWYDFSFRSANRKHRFLNTLALERQFGGKALYVSEMTGFEYNYEERDYSDQSDYENIPDGETFGFGGNASLRVRDYDGGATTSASGESSVPESPAKSSYRYCDTLPKKSQSRDGIATVDAQQQQQQQQQQQSTGSLGRRRLGNWFRKPKSTNCTPSQSPTHKQGYDGGDVTLTAAAAAELEAVVLAAELTETTSA